MLGRLTGTGCASAVGVAQIAASIAPGIVATKAIESNKL
jgi:F0F1-type ATP synthase membrane subunit c/vacuolar-type H+-ATPase subunit K